MDFEQKKQDISKRFDESKAREQKIREQLNLETTEQVRLQGEYRFVEQEEKESLAKQEKKNGK